MGVCGWSYFYGTHLIIYPRWSDHVLVTETGDGKLSVDLLLNQRGRHIAFKLFVFRIDSDYRRNNSAESIQRDMPGIHYFLGFFTSYERYGFRSRVSIGIPLWFLTGMLGLITIYIWRKTGKPKSGGAFPVETKKLGAM